MLCVLCMQSALRGLSRRAAGLRAALTERHDPQLPLLNTLAVVAGAYFGQDPGLLGMAEDMDMP